MTSASAANTSATAYLGSEKFFDPLTSKRKPRMTRSCSATKTFQTCDLEDLLGSFWKGFRPVFSLFLRLSFGNPGERWASNNE